MKVLHFGRFHRSDFGGIERHVDSLIAGLKSRVEIDNVVANERWRAEVERHDGSTVYRVPSLGLLASVYDTVGAWAVRLRDRAEGIE